MKTVENDFENLLRLHLKKYYIDTLGLANFESRYNYRLNEENIEICRLTALLKKINLMNKKDLKLLIVGSGWGGMLCAAKTLGLNVYGLDIDQEEILISKLRLQKNGFQAPEIKCCRAEDMLYEDDFFDLIYCFSVVEHVDDVDLAVRQMFRVLKPGGFMYVQTQNFNIPWEPHYKMILPTFAGKTICKWILRMRGRNPDYLDTINFIKKKSFYELLFSCGAKNIEDWDIVVETGVTEKQKNFRKRSLSEKIRSFISEPDRYLYGYLSKVLKYFKITNINYIVTKQ